MDTFTLARFFLLSSSLKSALSKRFFFLLSSFFFLLSSSSVGWFVLLTFFHAFFFFRCGREEFVSFSFWGCSRPCFVRRGIAPGQIQSQECFMIFQQRIRTPILKTGLSFGGGKDSLLCLPSNFFYQVVGDLGQRQDSSLLLPTV